MKTKNMLMMAAITIFTMNSFAQSIAKQTRSPKERMKMEVMKIPVTTGNSLMKSNMPGRCPVCRIDLNLSGKEKMKMEVMKRITCSGQTAQNDGTPGKCSNCGMRTTAAVNSHFCNMTAGTTGGILNAGTGLSLSPKEKMKREVMLKL